MGNYNPDWPYVLGNQWAPLVADQVLLDTSVEVGYTFRAGPQPANVYFNRIRVFVPPPPGQPSHKQLIANVFWDGEAAGSGPSRKLVIPCTSGASAAAAAVAGGASTFQAAVQNPSDAGTCR